jgi:uncharacterized phiE125 gp8 family phage protein
MALRLITPPSAPAVLTADAKLAARISGSVEDSLVDGWIRTATRMAEQATGRAVMPQTHELTLDAFPSAFRLTRVPVQSVASLIYVDVNGIAQTLASNQYLLDNADDNGSAYVVPAYGTTWPATCVQINAVKLQYVAGYADAASVPDAFKDWIKLCVGTLYENRESEVIQRAQMLTLGIHDRMLDAYKIWEM